MLINILFDVEVNWKGVSRPRKWLRSKLESQTVVPRVITCSSVCTALLPTAPPPPQMLFLRVPGALVL